MQRAWTMMFLLATIMGSGCGSEDDSTAAPVDCRNPKSGVINENHGHDLAAVCASDVGASLTLTLTGDHTHDLAIDESQVELIQNGNMVIVNSSAREGHTHAVTFN